MFVVSELYSQIIPPHAHKYEQHVQAHYTAYDEEKPYEIIGENNALVVSFLDFHDQDSITNDLSRYVRPVYFTANSVNDNKLWENETFYEGIPCHEQEVHSDHRNHKSFRNELDSNGPWYCANLTDYTLKGFNGYNLYMSV